MMFLSKARTCLNAASTFRHGLRAAATPSLMPTQTYFFSTEAPAEEENKTAAAEPAEPKGKSTIGDGEWGIKYDDECLKFEQEW